MTLPVGTASRQTHARPDRTAPMTKPITPVGLMQLYEQARFQPSGPISKRLPAFEKMKVGAHNESGRRDAQAVFLCTVA